MKIKVSVVGFPEMTQPVEADFPEPHANVARLLDYLEQSFRPIRASLKDRRFLSMLIDGRNVLSLPDKFETELHDGDEVILTVQVLGG